MPDIAKLVVEVTPKGIAEARTQLDALAASSKETGVQSGSMMDKFRNMQAIMQGPVAAFHAVSAVMKQVIAVGADLVNAFAESEQGIAKLEAVLAATGNAANLSSSDIQAMASEMQRLTMFEDDAVIAAQTVLLTFKQIGQDEFPRATRAAADMATVMGMDLQSAITMVGKALNEPVEGIGALRRVGVQLTDSQEALVKTMMETNDIAGAQAIIMGELESQFGGAAEAAANTATGAFVQYQNAVSALKEELGALIAEGFAPLTRALTEYIQVEASLAGMSRLVRELQNGTRELNQDSFGQLLDSLKSIEDEMKRIEQNGVSIFEADQYRGLQQQYQRVQAAVVGYREEMREAEIQQDRLFARQGGGQRPGGPAIPAGTPDAPAGMDERSQDLVKRRIAAMEASRLEIALMNREIVEGILSREEAEDRIIAALEREREALLRLDEEGMQSGVLEGRLVAIKTTLTEMAGLIGPVQEISAATDDGAVAVLNLNDKMEKLLKTHGALPDAAASYIDELKKIEGIFTSGLMDGMLQSFTAMGEALASGENAGEAFGNSLQDMITEFINQMPMLLLRAGLMVIGTNFPLGAGLILASGLVAVFGGAMAGSASSSSSSTTSSEAAKPITSIGPNGRAEKSSIVVNNYSNATATATETTGADGTRQIMVTVENVVKSAFAQGKMDGVMARYGARPQGVRT